MRFKKLYTFFLCLFVFSNVAFSQAFVQDEAQIISVSDMQRISNFSAQVQQQTGIEIAILTLETLGDQSLEEKALSVFENWGIGSKKDDKGLLLLVALKENKVRIEVGYGLEGILPDSKVGMLLDQFLIPPFKQGLYSAGIMNTYIEILKVINQEYPLQINQSSSYPHTQIPQVEGSLFLPVLIVLACLLPFKRGRRLLYYALLFSLMTSSRRSHHSFGSFGGSGFGGFGGGLSGGGGASRSW